MIRRWKRSDSAGGLVGAILANLSKDWTCVKNRLLIGKLYAHNFDRHSSPLIHLYLSGQKQ